MRSRFDLLFPYVCGAAVLLAILWSHERRTVTSADPFNPAEMEVSMSEYAAVVPETGKPGGLAAYVDPVCRMEVGNQTESTYKGGSWYFCSGYCRDMFNSDPERYLANTCLVCRCEKVYTAVPDNSPFEATWQGKKYLFCSEEHRIAFRGNPVEYFVHSMWGLPGWLYYTSIALILLISFGVMEVRAHIRAGSSRRGKCEEAQVVVQHQEETADTESGIAHSRGSPPVRYDLLQSRLTHRLLASPTFRFALRAVFVALFALIIAAGLFGNQIPSKNIAPLLTWTVWWGGLIWLVAYMGKMWCYVCPWDAISEWAESLKLWGKKKTGLSLGLAWPRFLRNIWPATLLFILLTWLELGFGVTLKPRATAWLALIILMLAFFSIFLFSRKSFCRYGCLVGRVSGLYALFAPVELRARDLDVCRNCATRSCYKGNERGEGCPTFEFPATMNQNTYCIMCMECIKTCESKNITLQARPWGVDLFAHRRPRSDEAYLALVMLSLTGFHGLTMTAAWGSAKEWIEGTLGLGETLAFSAGMAATMISPVLLYAALVFLSRLLSREKTVGYKEYFIRYAYALLPIALFYHLAHNSEHLFMEGQKVLALFSDPFGLEWDIFGTAGLNPQPIVSLPTLWILQVFFVTIGHVFSLWTARHAAGRLFPNSKAAFRSQLPMLLAMILFSMMSLWLLKQPMEMRTSAM